MKHYCAKANKKSNTGIKQNAGATKWSKIKIHNSKISSNLDLPHSLVFNVRFSSLSVCVGDIKRLKTTENKLDLECILWTRWPLFCTWRPSARRANYPSRLRSQNHFHLSEQFVRKQARWPPIFSQVFAENTLIKNIFEEEKNFESRTWFFGGK